jgi:hypothetical protein
MTSVTAIEFTTPPGWIRIDTAVQGESASLDVTDRLLAPLPPEQRARARGRVNAAVREAVLRARSAGAVQLVLPLDLDLSVTLPASFTVQPLPVPEDVDPLQAVAAMTAGESGFDVVEGAGVFALRASDDSLSDDAETRRALDALVEIDAPESRVEIERWAHGSGTRRVRYIVGDPELPGSWYLVVFVAQTSADPQTQELAAVMVNLFDLIMATVRFRTEPEAPPTVGATHPQTEPGSSDPGQTE